MGKTSIFNPENPVDPLKKPTLQFSWQNSQLHLQTYIKMIKFVSKNLREGNKRKEHHLTPERYTSSMFAELLEVSPAMVRQWHRRGWLRESEVVQKLVYFSLTELLPAKRLARLAKNGLPNAEIAKKLDALQVLFPGIDRPIAVLDLRIDGRDIFLTKENKLVDTVGQELFDFAQTTTQADQYFFLQLDTAFDSTHEPLLSQSLTTSVQLSDKGELCRLAWCLEEQGQLEQAVELFRAALAAGGHDAQICFQLAELLYRLDDKTAARERYYMAIEIDENFVEARAGLGCVLAETGDLELAVSAFQGALLHHPDYADVHYHLGRTLQKLGKPIEAEHHIERFRELMPTSPWAESMSEAIWK